MEKPLARRLRDLRADFKDVMGEPFHHFYCPVLFLDDEAELCKAHIVNAVFAGSTRWTVQRKDVDNFYGHVFESDFVDIRHRGHRPDEVLADLELSKRLRPQVVVDGRRIEHYVVAEGPVPNQYSPFVVDGRSGPVRLPSRTANVSNDNPFSEAQFNTLKYRPASPERFGSIQDARAHCHVFFPWYNTEHHHGHRRRGDVGNVD